MAFREEVLERTILCKRSVIHLEFTECWAQMRQLFWKVNLWFPSQPSQTSTFSRDMRTTCKFQNNAEIKLYELVTDGGWIGTDPSTVWEQ